MTDFDNAHDIEVERAVLHVLLDGRHRDAAALTQEYCPTKEHFFHREHQMIVTAVYSLIRAGSAVGRLTIETELRRLSFQEYMAIKMTKASSLQPQPHNDIEEGDSLLARVTVALLNDISATAFGSYAGLINNLRTLAEFHAQRELIRAMAEYGTEARKPSGSRMVSEISDRLIVSLGKITDGKESAGHISDAIDSAAKRHQSLVALGNARAASWGLPGLDSTIPLRPGRFIVLAAQPGHGKSSLAMQAAIASADLRGKGTVGMISLEMPSEELGTLFAARELHIPSRRIENGQLTPDQMAAMEGLILQWREKDIFLRSSSGRCTVDDACAWVRRIYAKSKGHLAVVTIDYLQLMDKKGRQSDFEMLSEATRAFKRLAIDLRICLLVLSQMNREGTKAERDSSGKVKDNPEPRLADLRGSGTIEQDADGVVFIYPPKESHSPDLPVMLRVAKNRGGPKPEPIDAIFRRGNGQTFEQNLSLARVIDPMPQDTSRAHHSHEPQSIEDQFRDAGVAP